MSDFDNNIEKIKELLTESDYDKIQGYVVDVGLNNEFQYVSYDTTYITGFGGFEVPCVNGSSYSREDGMVNTVIAPVRSMKGDNMTVFWAFYDDWKSEQIDGNFKIVLD